MSNQKTNSVDELYPKKRYMIPLLIVMAIIPIIVFLKVAPTHITGYNWYSGNTVNPDSFLYYKHLALSIIGAVMLCILIVHTIRNKKNVRKVSYFIVLFGYAVLVILSTVFSNYKKNAVLGVPDQYETVFVLLTYCVIAYYGYQFVRTEDQLRFLMKGLAISASYICILGLFQVTGHDLITTNAGSKIVQMFSKIKFSVGHEFGNDVFLTMFNPNYAGVYFVLLIPVIITLCIYTKQRKTRIFYMVLLAASIICLIGSGSLTGEITLCVSLVFLLILNRHLVAKYKKIVLPIILAVCVLGVAGFVGLKIPARISNMLSNKTEANLKMIETKDDCVAIHYQDSVLNMSYTVSESGNFDLALYDNDFNAVQYAISEDGGSLTVTDERYPSYFIRPTLFENTILATIQIDGIDWSFTNQTGDNTYYYVNNYGHYEKIHEESKGVLPKSFDSFASHRGFIWSRTIPMLKDHVLLGAGPDCFLFEFPNDDYIGFANNGFSGQVMTKPHNLYLQIGVQTGVVSVILFVVFYLCYFISSVVIYMRGPLNTYSRQIGAAMLVSTAGYMFSGLFNDSTVTVTPIFWAFIGIGIAINACEYRKSKDVKENHQ